MLGQANSLHRGWHYRLHAALLERFSARYERLVADRKQALLGPLCGDVLEIGPGTGPNLHFLANCVHWRGVDPNVYMAGYVGPKAAALGLDAHLEPGFAEDLPAADASVDAVVSTLVLCSVSDPAVVMAEILRVLKPGGQFVFVEHVAAPLGSGTRRRQDWLCPMWRRLADGCHPNRETWKWINAAGFDSVDCEHFRLNLPIAGPHIAGVARKQEIL